MPPGAEAAYLTIGYGGGTDTATVPGHYTDGFHHYRIEWTPQGESIAVDGTVLLRSARVSHAERWLGFVMSNGDNLTGVPSASTPLPAEFLIEHVRVYAYAPHAAASRPKPKRKAQVRKTAAARSARPSPSASPLPAAASSTPHAPALPPPGRSNGGALPVAAVSVGAGTAVVLASGATLAWWGRVKRRRARHSRLR